MKIIRVKNDIESGGKLIRFLFLFIFLLMTLTSCGLTTGSSSCSAVSAPTGTALYQGTFTGQNGSTVAGTAQIYNSNGNAYILYIGGLSVSPAPTSVIFNINGGGTPSTVSTSNYTCSAQLSFTANAGTAFSSVTVYASSNTTTPIGTALLISSN